MVFIQPGTFTMGVSQVESKREKTEDWDEHARPQHEVAIRHAFLLGKYPVTRGEYAEFARETNREWQPPDFEQTDRHPAVNVSFEDAVAYAAWLSRRTGRRYRLPSEAEWEYACRAGTKTARYWGDKPDRKRANVESRGTSEVEAYSPNPWGLHDMLGNVWEWIEDIWHENYAGAPDDGAAWIRDGDPGRRVLRGGSWNNNPRNSRAGNRDRNDTGNRNNNAHFRLASTPPCQSRRDQGPIGSAEGEFRDGHDEWGGVCSLPGDGVRFGPLRRRTPVPRLLLFTSPLLFRPESPT
jgi:formylglycine-generating enzyme required for sulfatase activity